MMWHMHLGMYFPGGSGPGQDPFFEPTARLTIGALEQAGAFVVPVRYDDDIFAPFDRELFESGIRREVRGALAYYQPDRVTIAGKSRGTHALHVVCSEDFGLPADTRLIWLTPIWGRSGGDSWRTACANTRPALHIVGLADRYHVPERHEAVPGETVAIPGADHGLRISGDLFASMDVERTWAEAVHRFAARV